MKKNRLIFFSIFGAYQLFVFLFTLYINKKQSDPLSLLPLLSHFSIFIYGAFFGVLLMIVDFIWSWMASRRQTRNEEEMILENNTLKAKIYDLQHDKKESQLVPPPSK